MIARLLTLLGLFVAVASAAELHDAVSGNDVASVIRLLKSGASVTEMDDKGRTPLMVAAASGNAPIIRELLSAAGPKTRASVVNARDGGGGRTALILSCGWGRVDAARELLEAGADVEIKDTNGWTALAMASASGDASIVGMLLNERANVDTAASDGATPLMLASRGGHKDVVEVLLDANADANAAMDWGRTALMIAVEHGSSEVVRALVAAGANVDAKDKGGLKARDLTSFDAIIDILEGRDGAAAESGTLAEL